MSPTPPDMLRLMLVDAGDLALDQYQVFAGKRFPFLDGHVELRVIGASSIILVEAAGVRLAEVMACGASPNDLSPLVEAGLSLQMGCEARVVHHSDRCDYTANIRTFPLTEGAAPKRSRSLPYFVDFRFPAERRPLTDIDGGEIKPGYLMFRTWHEYPELGIYVRSGSTWDFRPISERRAPLEALLARYSPESSEPR